MSAWHDPPGTASPSPDPALPEPTGVSDVPPWLEPYPDALLDDRLDEPPGPEPRYDSTEAISLAFITALQLLPPRRRAALVLRDVLGYQADEVARMLDTTETAVDAAVEGARSIVEAHLADCGSGEDPGRARRSDTTAEDRIVARLIAAFEHADLDSLVGLLVADVKLSMPPAMMEYRGIESAHRVLAAVTFRPGRAYRVVPTRANGQPAFGLYLADPHAGIHHAYCLLVITTAGDHITAITGFGTNVMPRFGLPRVLPEED